MAVIIIDACSADSTGVIHLDEHVASDHIIVAGPYEPNPRDLEARYELLEEEPELQLREYTWEARSVEERRRQDALTALGMCVLAEDQ